MRKIYFKKNNIKNRGFTLVEAMVAISIFTASILAMVSVLSNNLTNINFAKQKMIAGYLGQEGIEYMRNMRDTYVLYQNNTNGWNDFQVKLLPCDTSTSSNGCYFDINRDETGATGFNLFDPSLVEPITHIYVATCPSTCSSLTYHDTSGEYNYDSIGGVNSGFIRKITKRQISDDEMQITSTVYWTQGSVVHNVSFSDDFFNWQQ